MYHKHHTRGIVVYGTSDGDDSRRTVLFTEDFGLISVKVQGSRKLASRLRFGTQDYSFGDFSLIKGKNGWKLVSANVESNCYEDFKIHKNRFFIVANIINFVTKNIGIEEENKILFKIITDFISFLKIAPESKVPLAECVVMLRIIHNLGFLKHDPEFSPFLLLSDLNEKELELIAPKKVRVIEVINESMKAANLSR